MSNTFFNKELFEIELYYRLRYRLFRPKFKVQSMPGPQ